MPRPYLEASIGDGPACWLRHFRPAGLRHAWAGQLERDLESDYTREVQCYIEIDVLSLIRGAGESDDLDCRSRRWCRSRSRCGS